MIMIIIIIFVCYYYYSWLSLIFTTTATSTTATMITQYNCRITTIQSPEYLPVTEWVQYPILFGVLKSKALSRDSWKGPPMPGPYTAHTSSLYAPDKPTQTLKRLYLQTSRVPC